VLLASQRQMQELSGGVDICTGSDIIIIIIIIIIITRRKDD
jgi:hypothetical protein